VKKALFEEGAVRREFFDDVAKRKKKEGGWLWDGHAFMQSTGKMRRCEQMGREVREGTVEEEGTV